MVGDNGWQDWMIGVE